MTAALPSWYESAAALLSEPDPGPTPFLVENLIVDQAVAAIQGPAKVGKTWLVLELAVAIVAGRSALDCGVPKPGPVLLVLEESGRAALHRRLGAIVRGRATNPSELAELYFAANRRVRLNEDEWRKRLLEAGKALRPRVVILDPLARVKGASVDENSQREMGPVLEFLRELRDETGAAVVFVHHQPHEGARMRGTADLEATWESKITVARDDAGVYTIGAEHREAEASDAIRYRLAFDQATESVRLARIDEPTREDVLREQVAEYVRDHPEATANETADAIEGRRRDILAAYRAAKAVEATETLSLLPDDAPTRFPTPGNHREPPSSGHPGGVVPPEGHTPVGGALREPPGAGAVPSIGEPDFLSFVRGRYRAGHLTRAEWLERVALHGLIAGRAA